MGLAEDLKNGLAFPAMFFAGLILLIPHRIGTSGDKETSDTKEKTKVLLRICMLIFLFLMSISSIYMYRIYISGGDFGHLNSFYFSLIFLTLFDGFANACAFALNGKASSLLSAGIPLSGFLVTLLHYIYKIFSDSFLWDDFDYHVLRIQLLCNILIISFTLLLWSFDQIIDIFLVFKHNWANSGANCHTHADLFGIRKTIIHDQRTWNNTGSAAVNDCVHMIRGKGTPGDIFNMNLSPICMLAISLGTVYAFYPSIAPYSIIDIQYASIIELWILIISALLPLFIAILDMPGVNQGPGQKDPDNWVGNRWWWNLVWICAIFYILCIQIFMSLLHYPHSLLSCLFNNPLRIGFISVLFNTLRELLQALGFAGAGKQATIINLVDTATSPSTASDAKITGTIKGKKTISGADSDETINPSSGKLHVITAAIPALNTTIAATNKLITLFVMMFCVFTGDGYLQHYRRCCRDNWPTTGYTKYQSFFYWLHYGFKGGIKSITSSFTDLYYHNLRPQFISYA